MGAVEDQSTRATWHAVSAAPAVLDLALRRPARLGGSRLVCVDGPAGSGKSTLATQLDQLARQRGLSTSLVNLDDLYPGWDGLPLVGELLRTGIVEPMAAGRSGRYRRYDWASEEYAEQRTVSAADLVVVEGVGAGDPSFADHVSALVFVEAPVEVRLRRGVERDGVALRDQWLAWLPGEAAMHARDRTRARADLVVDGVSGEVTTATGPGS